MYIHANLPYHIHGYKEADNVTAIKNLGSTHVPPELHVHVHVGGDEGVWLT